LIKRELEKLRIGGDKSVTFVEKKKTSDSSA